MRDHMRRVSGFNVLAGLFSDFAYESLEQMNSYCWLALINCPLGGV